MNTRQPERGVDFKIHLLAHGSLGGKPLSKSSKRHLVNGDFLASDAATVVLAHQMSGVK